MRSLALVEKRKRRAAPRCLGVGPGGTALRYSPPPARKKAKAFFRLRAPASAPFLDDAPKAAQRRPPLALGTVSLKGEKRKYLVRGNVTQQRLAQRRRQLRRRPRNGAGPGPLSEKTL